MSWLLGPCLAALASSPAAAQALEWPHEITAPEGTIVLYQPQPETLEGNVLTARAAISLELKDRKDPVWGAMWFSARLDTDQEAGTAILRDVKITRVGWPDSKDAGEQRFTQIVEATVPEAGYEISLERLSASLATAELERKSLAELKNDPPKIVFSNELAVLLLYDGEPRFSKIENSDYERVLNTPFAVARNVKSKSLYLSNGAQWYQAGDPLGPWSPTGSPPADLVKMLPAPEGKEPPREPPPKIVVATEPTEVIATDGEPEWKSLTGGQILYVGNTETPWLRELATGNMYVLLSGRWFRAKIEAGPWTFVRPDELPPSFKEIPPDSDIGGVRVSVAGTEEAEEAMLDAAIPQTAAIKRSEAKLDVKYDGEPKFEKVPGTGVSYAVNTGTQVLQIGDRYYAVDNGVWFTSASAKGPWVVADSIPEEEIQKIPPSSPVYNTTHVHIYESSPEVVYVGYTAGYLWSFPYYGVPVYGTGWYYPPYWGSYYYPHHYTWGFHAGYNPWTGWTYGVSWTNGFFTFGVSWGGGYGGYPPYGCCGGWYGGGYRGPVVIHHGDINIGNTINTGNRATVGDRMSNNPGISTNDIQKGNLYNRPENRARNAGPLAREDLQRARPSTRENNVYADRNGNVARRSGDQWESRAQGNWKPSYTPDTRDRAQQQARSGSQGIDRSGLDSAHRARSTGAAREYSAPSRARSGGGGRRR